MQVKVAEIRIAERIARRANVGGCGGLACPAGEGWSACFEQPDNERTNANVVSSTEEAFVLDTFTPPKFEGSGKALCVKRGDSIRIQIGDLKLPASIT